MKPEIYFKQLSDGKQRQYEALRAFYLNLDKAKDVAGRYGYSAKYFKKLRVEFVKALKEGADPFFPPLKRGPKKRHTKQAYIDYIVECRKRNFSIADIKVALHAKEVTISLDTIDKILKDEGFAPLPKRTRQERKACQLPTTFEAPRSETLIIIDEEFSTENGICPLVFAPLIKQLGILEAIKAAQFPKTQVLDDVQMVLSFLALKLMGGGRWSHDTNWNMDRALGLFAGLNVLPKSTTLSTYSYRVNRESNRKLLAELSKIFNNDTIEDGDFTLDFKAIPHWGDDSVLERNWAGSRSKAMKSILALIVQCPSSGTIAYTNAEVKHRNQDDAVLDFVDFWKEGRGETPKMLIFDSKFTTYQNLNKLNQSDEKIRFLTLRRRGRKLIEYANSLSDEDWKKIQIERAKGQKTYIKVHDSYCSLRHYQGKVRQIIITDHGREKPAFLITNDFDIDVRKIVKKYSRRWYVEQEICEQIIFFQLNQPSSSIVVKVDFDLTLSLLAHNLYRSLAQYLVGFEHCRVDSLHRKFLDNGATITIKDNTAVVKLKKKTHLPLLFQAPWLEETTTLPWVKNLMIKFESGTVC